jgi:hypothetical protein
VPGQRIKAGCAAAILLCGPALGVAQTSLDDLAADQMSVRELMRLDTALALRQAKTALYARNKNGPDLDTHRSMAQSGALKLLAIYGVGKKLLAEVTVGQQPYLYMRGRVLPVGIDSSDTAFRLRGISGSCVQLERKSESHTLCLHPSLWGG